MLIEALESSDAHKLQEAVHTHIDGTRQLIQDSFMESSERKDGGELDGTHRQQLVWKA